MKIKPGILLLANLLASLSVWAQEPETLHLAEAYTLAKAHHPLMTQAPLIDNLAEVTLQQINRERFPVVQARLEGRIQSEALELGGENSPVSVSLPLESYNGYVDVSYNLYDGGLAASRKTAEMLTRELNRQQLQVSLRGLEEQVNAAFFAVQLSRQQKALLQTTLTNVLANLERLQAGYAQGTVLESELAKLKVRRLALQSEQVRLEGEIGAHLAVLSHLVGRPLAANTVLELPSAEQALPDVALDRPEQQLYRNRQELLVAREGLVNAARRPKISLFAQGGVGYPNPLNFAEVAAAPYALGGLRAQWQIVDWGMARKEREKLQIQVQQAGVEQQVFEFGIASQEQKYRQQMQALRQQLDNDEQVIALQQEILRQTEAQLNHGVITAADYLMQVNAELEARQQQALHQVQLQQLQVAYLTLFGQL